LTARADARRPERAPGRNGWGRPHPWESGRGVPYGRIFKTLHVLSYVDDEPYRREIKGMRNLQEGRHALAEKVFHGRKGQLFQRYYQGMEDQLGALGIVLNCLVLCYPGFLEFVFDAA
jgi:hypothetical protein